MFLTEETVALDREALVDDAGTRVTYGELKEDCLRWEDAIGSRNMILLLADRSIETVRFYYAMMGSKNVPLIIDKNSNIEFIRGYCDNYKPQYIWMDRKQRELLQGAAVYETDDHMLVKTEFDRYPMHEELAVLLTTSGSTGNSKIVRLSYRNLLENAIASVEALHSVPGQKSILALPLHYSYGMAICNFNFLQGNTVLITEKPVFSPDFERFLREEKVTILHGVPYIYEMLERIGFFTRLPGSICVMTMGGSKVNIDLYEKIRSLAKEHEAELLMFYGQTEGTALLTKWPERTRDVGLGCVGVACRGMSAYLDPEDSELCFTGSSVSMGYAGGWQDLARGDDNQGVLHTGDIARIDEEGYIYLLGRKKRFLKLLGIRTNMDDIEDFIEKRYGSKCACIGDDHHLVLYIAGEHEEKEIIRQVYTRYHISARQIYVYFVGEIPMNSSGKKDYPSLQRDFDRRC